ncbi:MAG TPA: hypothetical protein PK542_09270 [Treponemataceae bacterium]|nr:hypothetical protein [Treponemataceae bacterium]HPS44663.1 hypothetical protein [Treponemataceae bacterium]
MIAVLCKSACLASEIQSAAGAEQTVSYAMDASGSNAEGYAPWLEDCLKGNAVSAVFYEPSFFVDPARFRAIRPTTRFIVMTSPGEEEEARRALSCGAGAMLEKPAAPKDIRSVLSLVSS